MVPKVEKMLNNATNTQETIESKDKNSINDVPATMMSAWPERIFSAPEVIAKFEEMHAMVTVEDGTEIGIPAPILASLAMLEVRGSWITVP